MRSEVPEIPLPEQQVPMSDVDTCNGLRAQIKLVAERIAEIRKEPFANDEAMANMVLCYRHLEDANMRLGKAIQALDGGVSVYDKTTAVMR